MKAKLSYWDILLGLIAIGFGIYKWYKFKIYTQKRDDELMRKGKSILSYARFKSDSFFLTLYYLVITAGIVFIYNRIKGNMPNIIILIKYIFTN